MGDKVDAALQNLLDAAVKREMDKVRERPLRRILTAAPVVPVLSHRGLGRGGSPPAIGARVTGAGRSGCGLEERRLPGHRFD
jgi:hypothetical protein